MAVISPPKYVISVLEALERCGFEGFLVGGCVRDTLLGRRPLDWDVCTSAPPERVQALFPRTHPTGLKHGTVTVVSAGRPVEVTTYRADGEYQDHRRPESVEFVSSLEEDLRRRDFTINAMAMSLRGELRDPYAGEADLRAGIIRCVGEPKARFSEDALRMLRALRFSAVLGFEIEPSTAAAIEKCAPLTRELASERICAELQKTLCSAHPENASKMIAFGLLCRVFGQKRPILDLTPLRGLPKAAKARWAGLCAILLQGGAIEDAGDFLRSLRLDGATIKAVSAGVSAALSGAPGSSADWKRLSSRIGDGGCFCCAAAAEALKAGGFLRAWRKVESADECRSVSSLAVSGEELKALGFKGPEIGAALTSLLDYAIENPDSNRRELLLARLSEH